MSIVQSPLENDELVTVFNENLRMVYQEVCNSYHANENFREKLLGFLPLVSGAGIFILLNNAFTEVTKMALTALYLQSLGIFGVLITLGLSIYELRLHQKGSALIMTGKKIEAALNVAGQFTLRSPTHLISNRLAASIIYSAVLAAWIFVAAVLVWPGWGWLLMLLVFVISFVVYYIISLKIRSKEDLDTSMVLGKMLKVVNTSIQAPSVIKMNVERFQERLEKLSLENCVPTQKDWQELNELMERLMR